MPDLTSNDLQDRFGGPWGECPAHPRFDWVTEVANDDTSLGYWEWLAVHLVYDAERTDEAAGPADGIVTP